MLDGRFLGTLEAVLGHAEAVLAPPFHEKMHALVCTLLESFRPPPSPARPAGASLRVVGGSSNKSLDFDFEKLLHFKLSELPQI